MPASTQPDEQAGSSTARARFERIACACIFAPGAASGWYLELGGADVVLGRDPAVAHGRMAADAQASWRHAELRWSQEDSRYWLYDLDSSNGTHLNGRRITRAAVASGDIIRCGHTVVQIVDHLYSPAKIEPPFVGRSTALRTALARIEAAARSSVPVLITGETGTGKELVAEAIHRASGRAGVLCAVNCAALPRELVEAELFGHEKGAYSGAAASRPGLFRAAEGGTLFLDEVGELAPEVQAKLLRALDAGAIRPVGGSTELRCDVRVVAATNRDLLREVANHHFRADLYARIAEQVVALEPLRRRLADLEPLWCHFAALLGEGQSLELSGAAAEALALYDWPFNVRELRQVVRRVLADLGDGGLVTLDALPDELRRVRDASSHRDEPAADPALSGSEHPPSASELRRLVEQFRGNVREVATFLGKDRKQVYRWLKRFAIEPKAYRNG
jgi:transcriptional regulator with GAF, ATPase, and Fis domain